MNSLALASRLALCLAVLAPFATGCVAGDADVDDDQVGEASEALSPPPPPPPPPPASCLDIRSAHPGAPDGPYTLNIGHDPAKPWMAFCRNMATTPVEFLSLQHVGPDANFSQYTAGGASAGTSARTQFSKVRIDPATLLVDISDQTFSTSSGTTWNGSTAVTSMPYGVAMSCDDTASGVGNIDLTGTPFAVAAGEFVQGGADNSGSATYSSGGRVVSLTGGGYCGWTCASASPSSETYNPFNQTGTFQLNLVYAP